MMTINEMRERTDEDVLKRHEAVVYRQTGDDVERIKCIASLEKKDDDYYEEWWIRPVDENISHKIVIVEKRCGRTIVRDMCDGTVVFSIGKLINKEK